MCICIYISRERERERECCPLTTISRWKLLQHPTAAQLYRSRRFPNSMANRRSTPTSKSSMETLSKLPASLKPCMLYAYLHQAPPAHGRPLQKQSPQARAVESEVAPRASLACARRHSTPAWKAAARTPAGGWKKGALLKAQGHLVLSPV